MGQRSLYFRVGGRSEHCSHLGCSRHELGMLHAGSCRNEALAGSPSKPTSPEEGGLGCGPPSPQGSRPANSRGGHRPLGVRNEASERHDELSRCHPTVSPRTCGRPNCTKERLSRTRSSSSKTIGRRLGTTGFEPKIPDRKPHPAAFRPSPPASKVGDAAVKDGDTAPRTGDVTMKAETATLEDEEITLSDGDVAPTVEDGTLKAGDAAFPRSPVTSSASPTTAELGNVAVARRRITFSASTVTFPASPAASPSANAISPRKSAASPSHSATSPPLSAMSGRIVATVRGQRATAGLLFATGAGRSAS